MQLKYAIETLLLMMDMNSSDEVSTSKTKSLPAASKANFI